MSENQMSAADRKFKKMSARIPTVKLKIPGKSIFEIRIPNFCYIQVIVFDLKLSTSDRYQVRYHEKNVKNIKSVKN